MEKEVKMGLDTAREMYKTANEAGKVWLLENFSKDELESPKGITWEEFINTCGLYWRIKEDKGGVAKVLKAVSYSTVHPGNKDMFKTEKQAKSALAFAQLSHIVAKYREREEWYAGVLPDVWTVAPCQGELKVRGVMPELFHFHFWSRQNAEQSLITNRQLWLDFWQLG